MNGAHDLGGMDGLGPINPEPETQEPVFHADWERKVLALTLASGALGQWSIDAARHARENRHPLDYLSSRYYELWLKALEKQLVENGLVTADELRSGRAERRVTPDDGLKVPDREAIAAGLARGRSYKLDTALEPRFKAGQQVRVRNAHPPGHTRAPRYARGRIGTVREDYGVYIFADKSAHGIEEGQHLYSVAFSARELWGPQGAAADRVLIDLWDDHLEPV